jgi:hypothetical protein
MKRKQKLKIKRIRTEVEISTIKRSSCHFQGTREKRRKERMIH